MHNPGLPRRRNVLRKLGHVEVRVEPEHVSEGLVGDNHAGEKCSTRRFVVELLQDTVNQSGYIGEQAAIVTKEGA